jgi:hypothetical protein
MASGIVPTAAHSYLEFVRPCKIESNYDITSGDTTGDHRWPAINEGIEATASCVVLGVRGADDDASQRTPQLVQALV